MNVSIRYPSKVTAHMLGLLTFILLLPALLPAQRAAAFLRKGDEAMQQADYYTALHYFRQAYESKAAPDVGFRLAEAAYGFQAFAVAEEHYELLTEGNAVQQYPTAWLGLGKSQFAQGNYNGAQESLNAFLATNRGSKQQVDEARKILASCAWVEQQEEGEEWTVERLGRRLNSPYGEFGAWKSGDTLYYTSYRYDKEDDKYNPPRKISKVLISKDERRGRLLSRGFNEDTILTAHVALNNAKTLLFFNRCQFTKGAKLRCDLCVREKDRRGRWQKQFIKLPEPVNLPSWTSTQPAILWDSVEQQEHLLFVSNRPGTEGGFDIWRVPIPGDLGKWEMPTALTDLNTADNEVTPMYAYAERQLYFSTDRSPGYGGYDLVRVPYAGEQGWGEIENLGASFNSSYDDTYPFIWSVDRLYFSSNRPGGRYLDPDSKNCCPDIFRADKVPPPPPAVDTTAIVGAPPADTPVAPVPPPKPVLRTLEDFLPLTLFYDNDRPDPRTRRATTKRTYEDTYFEYLRREDEYYDEYAENQSEQDALAQFFEEEVAEGYDRLELFSKILLEQLEAGQQVEIFLKGYTSPRAQGDYNLLLGKRRVSAVRNHFENWRSGTLVEYLDNGQLIISEVSFGETKAAASAQDERAGERLSIYSPEAARERRVEIVEVKRGQ
ncbi:MAG: hypothetical protein AAFO03_23720 [Bacteroidota bacterium]